LKIETFVVSKEEWRGPDLRQHNAEIGGDRVRGGADCES